MKSLGMRLFLGNVGLWLGGGVGSTFVFLCRRRSLSLQSSELPHLDIVTSFFDFAIPESFHLSVFVALGMVIGALLGFFIPKQLGDEASTSAFATYLYHEDKAIGS